MEAVREEMSEEANFCWYESRCSLGVAVKAG